MEGCSRIRRALQSLERMTLSWKDGGTRMTASDGTEAVLDLALETDTLTFSVDLPDGRMASIANIVPSDVQKELLGRCRNVQQVRSLVEPMLRIASRAERRDPSWFSGKLG